MLRMAGALLLTAGAAGLGLCAAGQLRDRVTALRALIDGLEGLRRELSFRRTAMPELMERAARQAREPVRFLFAHCRDHLDELGARSFGQIWAAAVDEVPELMLTEGEKTVALELGQVLGRYDAADQITALERTEEVLRAHLVKAEEDRRRLGRVYTVLGAGSGAMLAILLL